MPKLIYKPEFDEPRGGVHPLGYSRPINRPKRPNAKSGADELEIKTIWLLAGVNDVTDEDFAFVMKHEATANRLRHGAIKVIEPTAKENPSGTLADYSLADAREIIFNTYDTEALHRIPSEDRRPEIVKWTRERSVALEKADLASLGGDE